jgi:hypothetical protein
MPNTIQPKIKPDIYNNPNIDDLNGTDRPYVQPNAAKSNSMTAIIVILALAIVAALVYFYVNQGATGTMATDPVVTQQTQPEPVSPAPATPPGETIQDPAPVAPATPAPTPPAN